MAQSLRRPAPAGDPQGVIQVARASGFEGMVLYRGTDVTHRYSRHWHDELHLCAYTAGWGYLGTGGTSQRIVPGDFVVTPPGEVHQNWVDEGGSISYRSLYIDPAILREEVRRATGQEARSLDGSCSVIRSGEILQPFLRLHRVLEVPASRLVRDELMVNFLGRFMARWPSSLRPGGRGGRERQAIRKARDYIADHAAARIVLSELSRDARLSPFHLHRLFCREVGLPPHAYQTQMRINRAKALLLAGVAVSEVALLTGFADQSHLTRQFRRLVGVTPGRFRGPRMATRLEPRADG